MNFQAAEQYLSRIYQFPPQQADQARSLLLRYHLDPEFVKNHQLDSDGWLQWYDAVSTLTCLGMKDNHRSDPKRRDRSLGRRLRTQRTGSRGG